MLETFRKYTGLMFVVLILLFVGLVFFGSSNQVVTGKRVASAHGRGFTEQEYRRFVLDPVRMLGNLPRSAPEVNTYFRSIIGRGGTDYLVNRLSLQKAMKEFGIYASTPEIETYLRENIFWEDGAFNERAYYEFDQDKLKPLGMGVKDLNEITGEIIALGKLEEILGSGIDVSREAVTADYLSRRQQVSYQLVSFPLTDFETGIDPTEEEIKAKWEEDKANYLSDPERKISYIIARPDYAKIVSEKPAEPEPETEDKEEATPEENKKGEDAEAAEKPEDKLTPQEKKEAVRDLGILFDELLGKVYDGEDLAASAADFGLELKTTELLTKENLPPELSGRFRDTQGAAPDAIFGGDPEKPQVYSVGTDQWLFFRIDETVDATELSYEAARDEVRLDLIKELASEAMKTAADEKRDAVAKAIEGGKSFADATAELELKPVAKKDVKGFGSAGESLSEYNHCIKSNPGDLSEVFHDENETLGINRSFFLLVEKREVFENPTLETTIDTQVENQRYANNQGVLLNWLAQQRAEANLEQAETE